MRNNTQIQQIHPRRALHDRVKDDVGAWVGGQKIDNCADGFCRPQHSNMNGGDFDVRGKFSQGLFNDLRLDRLNAAYPGGGLDR